MQNETGSDSRVRLCWRLHIFCRSAGVDTDSGSAGKPRLEATAGGNPAAPAAAGDLCENSAGNWFHRTNTVWLDYVRMHI